jgi:uncharacterized protein
MKLKLWLAIAVVSVIATIGLAGCNVTGPQTPAQTSAAGPVSVNVNNQQGIWVNGQGTVTVTPNIATLNLGVSVQAAKVADAQAQAATGMAKVISALTANGVDQKDISTRSFNINQVTRYDNATQQSVVTGYQVSNIVNVTLRSIDKVGTIIDAVASAGGDLTRINSISFSVDNPSQYYSQARTLAMNNAKDKATQLASLAGVNLGRPVYIVENTQSPPVPYAVSLPVAAQAAPTTPISPGQTDITLNVQVAYAIQ